MVGTASSSQHKYAALLPAHWKDTVYAWLHEDIPSFDYGAYVVGDKHDTATLWCKSPGVMCGCVFVDEIFAKLNCTVEWGSYKEGDYVDVNNENPRIRVATVSGAARNILQGERTALNLMARASGIATHARKAKDLATKAGYTGAVAGTRKTTPGFRIVEKYAMIVGGVDTHRMDLSSMVMLKDNHIWSQGSITATVHKAREVCGFALKIEVEARSEEEAEEAIAAGADIVMLDNMNPQQLHHAASSIKTRHPHIILEGSGGITLDTLPEYFDKNIDVLSMGSMTQGVSFVDFSLKITV